MYVMLPFWAALANEMFQGTADEILKGPPSGLGIADGI